MKNRLVVLVALVLVLTGLQRVSAQTNEFFVGKWSVEVTGTPNGDGTSVVVLERKDGKLQGSLKSGEAAPMKFTRVEEKNNEITAYFTTESGYDVYLYLKKTGDNTAEGSMMDMFDAKAKRITGK